MDAIDDSPLWRYPGGYRWISPRRAFLKTPVSPAERVLTTGLPAAAFELEAYKPPPNLFLVLAETPINPDGIQHFANQYGLLGLGDGGGGVLLAFDPSAEQDLARAESRTLTGAPGNGELLSAWERHIQEMRQAVALWSDIREAQAGETENLAHHVRWQEGFVYYDSHPELPLPPQASFLGLSGVRPILRRPPRTEPEVDGGLRTLALIASAGINSEWLKYFRPGDCLMPAKYFLQRIVNEHLKGMTSPRLLWNVRRGRPHDLALFFVPENLLGVMWLQLAEAINGNRRYKRCPGCRTWIVISHESIGSRSGRSTCSNACRMKLYYGRKLEARQLQQAGLTLDQIARRLKADRKSVRNWIGAAKIKRRSDGKTHSNGGPREFRHDPSFDQTVLRMRTLGELQFPVP